MNSMWLVPAFASLFGGVAGMKSGREMQRQSKEQILLAEQNAMLAQRELDEQVRRQKLRDRQVKGAAKARAAASGARLEGSVSDYLSYMDEELGRQLDWTKSAGASKIRLTLQGEITRARALEMQGKSQYYSSMFSGITGAFNYMDRGGMFSGTTE